MTDRKKIAEVRGLIETMAWNPEKCRELAAKWNVSVDEVVSLYTTAVAELRVATEFAVESGDFRAVAIAHLRHLSNVAATKKRHFFTEEGMQEVDDPDIKSAVLAIESAAKIAGVIGQSSDGGMNEKSLMERALRVLSEKTMAPELEESNETKK